jgi:hypothetical protein
MAANHSHRTFLLHILVTMNTPLGTLSETRESPNSSGELMDKKDRLGYTLGG